MAFNKKNDMIISGSIFVILILFDLNKYNNNTHLSRFLQINCIGEKHLLTTIGHPVDQKPMYS